MLVHDTANTKSKIISKTTIQNALLLTVIIIYCELFYLLWNNRLAIDFYIFRTTTQGFFEGGLPYEAIRIPCSELGFQVGNNLNAPIFFWLFWPLTKLNHQTALMIWSFTSLLLTLFSVMITLNLVCSRTVLNHYRLIIYCLSMLFYPIIANIEIGQIGAFLAFLLVLGYAALQKKRIVLAAISWGILIAIKLFPALLFVYVLKKRQYKMLMMMACTVIVLSLIPVLCYGPIIYLNYFKLLPLIPWYGNTWNASLYGFLFRLFVDEITLHHLQMTRLIYIGLATCCMLWYLQNIRRSRSHGLPTGSIDDCRNVNSALLEWDQPFCLTVIVMLLLSPFGWLYYFPMLLLPLIMLGTQLFTTKKYNNLIIGIIAVFLLNFPVWNKHAALLPSIGEKLTTGSFWFYGLVLLAYISSGYNKR